MIIKTAPEVMEAMFVGLLTNDVSLSDIMVGLHNACAHGIHLCDNLDNDDFVLGKLMDGIDLALSAARKMENGD